MSESRAILDAVLSSAEPAVLATVVRVSGSAYRRPGARLLLCRDGRRVGGVSGGCLEGDIARKAWWRTGSGPAVVRYDSTGDGDEAEAAFGLGCNGVVDVLLERLDPAEPPAGLAAARRWLGERKPGVVARVLGGAAVGGTLTLGPDGVGHDLPGELAEAVRVEAESCLAGGSSRVVGAAGTEVFVEVVRPAQSLLVCGGGFDVPPLVRQAKAVGWHVTVFDPRAAAARQFADADAVAASVAELPLEPGGAAALVTHNFEDDKTLLPVLLRSPLAYVGVLGPKRRTDRLLAALADFAPTDTELVKLHAPVGLDVGAETPAEIALAIVAEVRAVVAGRSGGMLRDRPGPIHDRTPVPPTVPAEAAACSVGARP
jgi:xanthine/CO dehydrogenase XdhC/CoxF family maturation factor